jgi:hypothetical protein
VTARHKRRCPAPGGGASPLAHLRGPQRRQRRRLKVAAEALGGGGRLVADYPAPCHPFDGTQRTVSQRSHRAALGVVGDDLDMVLDRALAETLTAPSGS